MVEAEEEAGLLLVRIRTEVLDNFFSLRT